MSDFKQAIEYVLQNEGGFVDDPEDRGRATNMGITQNDLILFRGDQVTVEDVKNLTRNEAEEFYQLRYWSPLGCAYIEDQDVATAVLDVGVVCGIRACIHFVQIITFESMDGIMGSKTLEALNAHGPNPFIMALRNQVLNRFVNIVQNDESQEKFLAGWKARAERLLTLIK